MSTSPVITAPVITAVDPTISPTEVFNFASYTDDKTPPPQRARRKIIPKSKTVNKPEVFNIASDMEDKTPPQQVRRRLRVKQGMQVDIADNETKVMSVDEKNRR